MNFFRRNATKIPTPIELEVGAIELPKLRLRGSLFFYTPRRLPFAFAKRLEKKAGFRLTSKTAGKTVTLIYRGHTYERKL